MTDIIRGKVIEMLQKLSGHEFIQLTESGDTAIFAALYCARKIIGLGKVLIPDQGGWLSYPKFPKMLQMEVEYVKTDRGKINLEDLKNKVDDAKVLLYHSYSGYFVRNDVEEVYNICKGHCIVILDICASFGADDFSGYCDIAVSSFRKWKPVNLKYGGFLSTNRKILFEKPKEIFNTTSFDGNKYEEGRRK
jgi:dTDP-4-amino-4,6-dideoxygalactose transaminase